MTSIRFNEENVSVFMNYTDLERMMKECVHTTLNEMKNEQKRYRNKNGLTPNTLPSCLVSTYAQSTDGNIVDISHRELLEQKTSSR
jgi:hypothetical protein